MNRRSSSSARLGMTADGWNTEPGNEFCQRAGAAFSMAACSRSKDFSPEAIRLKDRVAMLLQFIQICKRMNPSMTDQLFQRRLRQTFNIHPALSQKWTNFCTSLAAQFRFLQKADVFCRSFRQLPAPRRSRAGHGKPVGTALCQITRNLRNDHVGIDILGSYHRNPAGSARKLSRLCR